MSPLDILDARAPLEYPGRDPALGVEGKDISRQALRIKCGVRPILSWLMCSAALMGGLETKIATKSCQIIGHGHYGRVLHLADGALGIADAL